MRCVLLSVLALQASAFSMVPRGTRRASVMRMKADDISRRDALAFAAATFGALGMPQLASAMPKGVRNGFEGKSPKGQKFIPGKGLRNTEGYEIAMPKGVRNGFEGKSPKGQKFIPGKGLRNTEGFDA